MEMLADKIHEATASFSERIDGSVRVGSPDGFGNAFLSNILPCLQETHPNLNIELVPLPISQKLWRRDVDIAISLDRPDTGRILMRKLTDYDLRIYGAPKLLASKGVPQSRDDLRHYSFVGYIDDLIYTDMLDFNRLIDPELRVSYKGATVKAQIDAVKAGAGLGVLPCYMVRDTELLPVLDTQISFVRSYWLLLPEELGTVERVRVVADYIAKVTREQAAQFSYQPVLAPYIT
jgi:DNA-binding transcriptional LysR family regulator